MFRATALAPKQRGLVWARLCTTASQSLFLLILLLSWVAPVVCAPPTLSSDASTTNPQAPVENTGNFEPPLSYRNGQHSTSGHGYTDPSTYGGSMLLLVENGMREPINAIISGQSDPYVLSDAGFRDYVRSIGFSFECFDMHLGTPMRADLGDGNGMALERFEYREIKAWDAGRTIGSCRESVAGGNHFRGTYALHWSEFEVSGPSTDLIRRLSLEAVWPALTDGRLVLGRVR